MATTPFNIRSKELRETAVCHLTDVDTGAPLYADDAETLPLTITVSGKASKAYKKALANLARENDKRSAKPGRNKSATFEENIEANHTLLATVSVRADNFDMGDGVAIDNKDKFMELYSDDGLYWIRDQVSEFLNEDSNFNFLAQ